MPTPSTPVILSEERREPNAVEGPLTLKSSPGQNRNFYPLHTCHPERSAPLYGCVPNPFFRISANR
jgi:hypothetical protein